METVGLFAGIGGIELGLERAEHRTRLFCEIDEGAIAVLEKHFPGIEIHPDVSTLEKIPSSTELLTAGFPCQDLSQAGSTRGITGERSGLIGHVLDLLERARVPNVLIENVPFMLLLRRGQALDVIIEALERLGYKWAYRVVNTMAFGLPQRRKRVFLLACQEDDPRDILFADDAGVSSERGLATLGTRRSFGFYWTEGRRGLGGAIDSVPTLKGGSAVGIPSPPAIVLGGRSKTRHVVTPDIRDAERLQGFPAEWTLAAQTGSRMGPRWKLVGNAVTVRVAEWLGHRLRRPGEYQHTSDDQPLHRKGKWPDAAWNVGQGRFVSSVSDRPLSIPAPPIRKFLEHDSRDLSEKAARGFLSRLEESTLKCYPDWFKPTLRDHIERMSAM